jgi:RNA polymerase sigma factor (sigma-70 family)
VTRLVAIPGGRIGPVSGPPAGPAAGRERGLLEELYRRHAAAVHARCRYLLRDEDGARDATQDVFVRALRALPELEAAASPTAFLLRAATNHCLNLLRARRASWREEVHRMARERTERGIEPEARELVRALLGAASQEAQEVAVLYFVDELTQGEIGEATGRSLPTVRKRLREFLAAARGALAEAFPGLALPDPEELP